MVCWRLPTEVCTRTLLPVSFLRSVMASHWPTPPSVTALEMMPKWGRSSRLYMLVPPSAFIVSCTVFWLKSVWRTYTFMPLLSVSSV